ncbi:MAG: translation elongation factor 4 [Bacillota bacterium]|jgi:GTP-binding protein LepA|nr:translation elongation factor 4 [Bacillota bacterium]NLH86839.1 elongation factor 4 [Bacillota bacterium]HAN86198.1 elongation factor 4 [Bacillota bacterium]
MNIRDIRNFCIIAHIDHGKSTLADRILELTDAIDERAMMDQVLDKMDLERERGITIKLKPVRIEYTRPNGDTYVLNLIDTPGHVDFTYEVSRSLAACEGAILVVDATQGIEAQTLANLYLAIGGGLEIVPVVNKIDLPNAEPDRVRDEVVDLIGIDPEEVILTSAKTGEGVLDVLEAVVERIPPPRGEADKPLRALVFDSHFDPYRGVIAHVRIVEGVVRVGDMVRMMSTGNEYEVTELGVFVPEMKAAECLNPGEVGFLVAQIKEVADAPVGDTITSAENPAPEPLPGYRPATPMVYCGLYPLENSAYADLRDALDKLKLNDASITYEPETSAALGFGFRCGFLGLLHMEIVQERLEREYDLELITTAPSVVYRVNKTSGDGVMVDNPANLPAVPEIETIEEPFVRLTVFVPSDYIGPVMDLAVERRGEVCDMHFIGPTRVKLTYDMPLAEILYDFFDKLKSRTRGYASMEYEFLEYRPSDLVKLDILVGGKPVDALSSIVHSDFANRRGRSLVERLRKLIPRQLFDVPIQAAVGSRVIARETVKAVRKDVLAKCYGGDVSRKRKLLEKQKEGKRRMKQFGHVEIPQEAFMAVLADDEE